MFSKSTGDKPEYELTSINNGTFSNCNSITNIILPSSLTKIGDNAFELCKLNGTVEIPSTVTTIGTGAFKKQITWTSDNGDLHKIVNKTGRSFDWKAITGGPEPATFVTGTVRNWYGDIEVTGG